MEQYRDPYQVIQLIVLQKIDFKNWWVLTSRRQGITFRKSFTLLLMHQFTIMIMMHETKIDQ